ncbi:uncharacterized protein LOC115982663 isoform X3 [Quercus lobata]|uniref:uncharacterized protein LOC115982663 isoform X3 n=1 Tax=Quercus lobata TaxID=97700 RepID=UPI001247B553|nr:uncharacterized protein LOC115982663 isoform X3 [Quercus lobata]
MEDEDASPSRLQRRLSLKKKTHSHFNNYHFWKHKLREKCYKRVREDRTRLLWKLRLPSSPNHNNNKVKDLIQSAFEDIISDELKKIEDSSLNDCSKSPASALEANDVLWEYDGLHNVYQGECEEILLEMQRIFYEDYRAEPTRKEPQAHIETWEDEEDAYLARAVYEHMQLNDEQVNLDLLRVRLAEAHAEHLDRGCRLKPKFCMEARFDLTALYICCTGCNMFEVVM